MMLFSSTFLKGVRENARALENLLSLTPCALAPLYASSFMIFIIYIMYKKQYPYTPLSAQIS